MELLLGKRTQALRRAGRVTLFDDDALALDVSQRTQAVPERIELLFMRTGIAKKSDPRDLGLSRARRKLQRRRATEKRHELAPTHVHPRAKETAS